MDGTGILEMENDVNDDAHLNACKDLGDIGVAKEISAVEATEFTNEQAIHTKRIQDMDGTDILETENDANDDAPLNACKDVGDNGVAKEISAVEATEFTNEQAIHTKRIQDMDGTGIGETENNANDDAPLNACKDLGDIGVAKEISAVEATEFTYEETIHTKRIQAVLDANDLMMLSVPSDGDCFFHSLSMLLTAKQSPNEIRQAVLHEITDQEALYSGFNTCFDYHTMGQPGQWNSDLGDLFPVAAANAFNCTIKIISSHKDSRGPITIAPSNGCTSNETIFLALFSITGSEHYNPCISNDRVLHASVEHHETNTPPSHESDEHCNNMNEQSQANNEGLKKKTPDEWERNVNKRLRNTGQAYKNVAGKMVPPKRPKQMISCKCSFACKTLTEEEQQTICSSYWGLGDQDQRTLFVLSHTQELPCKSRTTTPSTNSTKPRNVSRQYVLPVTREEGFIKIRVCKETFLNTLCISNKTVQYNFEKKKKGLSHHDRRGKQPSSNKTSNAAITQVKSHILSFPRMESHYCRQSTSRQYLHANLNLKKLYDAYEKEMKLTNQAAVSRKIYNAEFKKMNLSFHRPKKDCCAKCFSYEHTPAAERTQEKIDEHSKHIKNKLDARAQKQADKEEASRDPSICAMSFDLQKVLDIPTAEAGPLYYLRKMSMYNLTMFNLVTKDVTTYVWDETNGKRGCNEISTCVVTFLKSLPSTVSRVILYSDSCSGQNKNMFMTAILHNYLQCDTTSINQVIQKYLEPGHTQMEVDSVHSTIERAKKGLEIFHPREWINVIKKARAKKPYTVVPLKFTDFHNAKEFMAQHKFNMKILTGGGRVEWKKAKSIRVTKGSHHVDVRYSMEDDWLSFNIEPKARRTRRTQQPDDNDEDLHHHQVPPAYSSRIPISENKKKDLNKMCKDGIIPETYHGFYEGLDSESLLRDELPEPDVLEDDDDDDQ